MGIARYLSKLASGLSSEGVISAAKGGTGTTTGGSGGPKISAITVTDSSYTNLDDTAVDVAGGYIKLTGSGFASGCQVLIGTVPATSITFVSATEVRAQVPATAAGTYIVYLVNSDGGVAIRVNGITFSTTPTWTTASPLAGSADEAISIQLAATGAATFSVAGGSSLPSGVTLSSGGLLSGTVTGISQATAYNFTIVATDAELQDSPKAFTINISVGDSYWKYVSLLLAGNGTNNATNNTILDSSGNNYTINRFGNTTQGSFSPFGGNWSNYFDGTGDNLLLAYNAAFNLTADFTIEFWYYPLSATGQVLNCGGGSNIAWASYEITWYNGQLTFAGSSANTGYDIGSETGTTGLMGTPVLNQWNHIAVTRTGNVYRGFINGAQGYTQTIALTPYSQTTRGISIGANYTNTWGTGTPTNSVTGYISNLRIVKGTSLYTTNFTPSNLPLTPTADTVLLTCQSSRFADNSINNFTITQNGNTSAQAFSPFSPVTLKPASYSLNIPTSGLFTVDYLSGNPNTSFGTGAFTVEGWYYPTGTLASKNSRILSLGRGSGTSWDLYISNGTALVWERVGTTTTTYSAPYTFNLNTWYHVVACRDGSGNLALFVNGTRVLAQANETTSYSYNSSVGGHYVGAAYNGTAWGYATGYFSNIRAINGATAYNPTQTTITVPTTALTVTAQTSLLLFGANGSDLSGNYAMSTISKTDSQSKMVTFNPFGFVSEKTTGYSATTDGGSIYFDGTGDYLNPTSPSYSLGTADWTAEIWYNCPTTHSGILFDSRPDSTNGYYLNVSLTSTGASLYYNSADRAITFTPNLGTWNHIAVVKRSNTLYTYYNGVQVDSVSDANTWLVGTDRPRFSGNGGFYSAAAGNSQVYISNFRIVPGTALYNSQFIPSATPLTAVSGTKLLLSGTNGGIVDSSRNNVLETVGDAKISTTQSKFGGSSMYFDGTGDYLSIPNSAALNLSSGDFTIEAWVYWTGTNVSATVVDKDSTAGSTYPSWQLALNGSSKMLLFVGSGNGITQSQSVVAPSTFPSNQWVHVAGVKNGSTLTLYQNGVSVATAAQTATIIDGGKPVLVGWQQGQPTAQYWNGYIDDLRITKGVARYTANFTPPTTALPTK